MYKIMIENTMTLLYKDTKEEGVQNSNLIGSLLNVKGIVELIQSLPISEYYINLNGTVMKLEIEQVLYAYDRILDTKEKEEKAAANFRRRKN